MSTPPSSAANSQPLNEMLLPSKSSQRIYDSKITSCFENVLGGNRAEVPSFSGESRWQRPNQLQQMTPSSIYGGGDTKLSNSDPESNSNKRTESNLERPQLENKKRKTEYSLAYGILESKSLYEEAVRKKIEETMLQVGAVPDFSGPALKALRSDPDLSNRNTREIIDLTEDSPASFEQSSLAGPSPSKQILDAEIPSFSEESKWQRWNQFQQMTPSSIYGGGDTKLSNSDPESNSNKRTESNLERPQLENKKRKTEYSLDDAILGSKSLYEEAIRKKIEEEMSKRGAVPDFSKPPPSGEKKIKHQKQRQYKIKNYPLEALAKSYENAQNETKNTSKRVEVQLPIPKHINL